MRLRLLESLEKVALYCLGHSVATDTQKQPRWDWTVDEDHSAEHTATENLLLSILLKRRGQERALVIDVDRKLVDKEGSWKEMLIISPPTSELKSSIYWTMNALIPNADQLYMLGPRSASLSANSFELSRITRWLSSGFGHHLRRRSMDTAPQRRAKRTPGRAAGGW
ncbi:hypothetical protein LTR85_001675 [Meristemomyces frigidus]|nr:hypothetical protein LTR85_001675 [Meristemomyces frigidus]